MTSTGNFFALDARVWPKVTKLGLNPAVAFLVLARFTEGDNVTTSASVNAVETYTGISRGRAKTALSALTTSKLVRAESANSRPQYKLAGFEERTFEKRKTALTANAIWLPNEIVSGARSEVPPVELLRQTQDVMKLKMFVEVYHAQNLREDGGIDRRVTWQKWERVTVGESHQWIVYGFNMPENWVSCEVDPDFRTSS